MKITAELDTETKDCNLYIDGQLVDSNEFTVGQYTYMCDEANRKISKFATVTLRVSDEMTITKNINIRDDKVEIAEIKDNLPRKIGEAKSKLESILSLAKIFNRK
jgi:hypothetical protein